MTTTTGNTHTASAAAQGRTRHVLLRNDLGQLVVGAGLRPWHRLLARCAATRLDRELATGTSPETSLGLAARAMQLTSGKSRRRPGQELAADTRGREPTASWDALTLDGCRPPAGACRCAGRGLATRLGRLPRWPAAPGCARPDSRARRGDGQSAADRRYGPALLSGLQRRSGRHHRQSDMGTDPVTSRQRNGSWRLPHPLPPGPSGESPPSTKGVCLIAADPCIHCTSRAA